MKPETQRKTKHPPWTRMDGPLDQHNTEMSQLHRGYSSCNLSSSSYFNQTFANLLHPPLCSKYTHLSCAPDSSELLSNANWNKPPEPDRVCGLGRSLNIKLLGRPHTQHVVSYIGIPSTSPPPRHPTHSMSLFAYFCNYFATQTVDLYPLLLCIWASFKWLHERSTLCKFKASVNVKKDLQAHFLPSLAVPPSPANYRPAPRIERIVVFGCTESNSRWLGAFVYFWNGANWATKPRANTVWLPYSSSSWRAFSQYLQYIASVGNWRARDTSWTIISPSQPNRTTTKKRHFLIYDLVVHVSGQQLLMVIITMLCYSHYAGRPLSVWPPINSPF